MFVGSDKLPTGFMFLFLSNCVGFKSHVKYLDLALYSICDILDRFFFTISNHLFYFFSLFSRLTPSTKQIFLGVEGVNQVTMTYKFEKKAHRETIVKAQVLYTYLKVHINSYKLFLLRSTHFPPDKGKSPEVPFHGITLPYSYFEVI